MRRATLRFIALAVLALLGAPVAMHVVLHDLHDHHDSIAMTSVGGADHGDHEHPVVSSAAPQVSNQTRTAWVVAVAPATTPATWTRVATTDRNVLSFGALRMDDDVGLQLLHSTFLI